MKNKSLDDIVNIISSFIDNLKSYLPALEMEVNEIITAEEKDVKIIERYLDSTLSLAAHGIGEDLFIKLLEYYKTIDPEGALFYWNEYDNL